MRILVCDDDEPITVMVTEALTFQGHEIRNSYDLEMLIWAREGWPDLILLDLMMPYISGASALYYLHNHPLTHTIPVVLMTAVGETAKHAARMGALYTLQKPFQLDDLYKAVEFATADHATGEFYE